MANICIPESQTRVFPGKVQSLVKKIGTGLCVCDQTEFRVLFMLGKCSNIEVYP